MLRALVLRADQGDTEALEQLAALEQLTPAATTLAGHRLHESYGYSHSELGAVLGISRQASVKRFGPVPLDSQPLGEAGYSWVRSWAWNLRSNPLSSAEVMRQLVTRLAGRRG